MKKWIFVFLLCLFACSCGNRAEREYNLPDGYLDEAENIPSFWLASTAEIKSYLEQNVKVGSVEMLGKSAGGRPIWGVGYGCARQGEGTTTWSGASTINDIRVFRGPDSDKKVLMLKIKYYEIRLYQYHVPKSFHNLYLKYILN